MDESRIGVCMAKGLTAALCGILGEIGRNTLPPSALAAAKSRLFHAIGISLASCALPAAQVAWTVAKASPGDCLVFGREQRVGADDAAFANGVIGHSSLVEDCGPGGLREGSHPGTFIIPAALAAAESVGASGARFLAGVVVGYEAVSRIGAAAPPSIVKRRFRPLGVMGPLGAAAAAAIILGADDEQLAAALAIASNSSGGSTQGIFEGTMEPYYQAGFAARNGLAAARLGLAGSVTSVYALEGDYGFSQTYGGAAFDQDVLLGSNTNLGICAVGTKRFAACLQNQQTLALIVDGLSQPLVPASIKRVVIRRPESGTNGLNSPGVSRSAPFDNMLSAQMSARFTAAAALLGLPVGSPEFYLQNFKNPEIWDLTNRIDLVPSTDESVSVLVEFEGRAPLLLDADRSDVLFPSDATIRSSFLTRSRPTLCERGEQAALLLDRLEETGNIRELTRLLARS